ncbi:hypothetical protein ACFE04_014750 [Oxalis oulophora]
MASLSQSLLWSILVTFLLLKTIRGNQEHIHERILNLVKPGVSITVHCTFKSGDFGTHVIKYDSLYMFDFFTQYWAGSQILCSVSWESNLKYFYIKEEEINKPGGCEYCIWRIRENGPCHVAIQGDHLVEKCSKWINNV